ncbi:hypothetical protein PR048_015944 [Dryococelus australis]|uniref:Retroviral polymerase SH3-like domain-containing protein n=1 Tax=Dryococelus australis TaxID=614101 RepID=A0ABQ9HID0_9NEOP|nr:hypothetical protein PR048_015944 [Dryococelus australis]
MDKKAQKGVLIGYDEDDGYKIWCGQDNRVVRSRDVTFNEEPLFNSHIVKHNFNEKVEDQVKGMQKKEKNNEDHDSVQHSLGDEEEEEFNEEQDVNA